MSCLFFLLLLFVTSHYWVPIPASEFDPGLIASLGTDNEGVNLTQYLPAMIPLIERPWLDIYSGTLFRSFNVTKWEESSLRRAIQREKAKERAANPSYKEKVETKYRLRKKESEKGKEKEVVAVPDAMDAFRQSWNSMMEVVRSPTYVVAYAWLQLVTRRHSKMMSMVTSNATEQSNPSADSMSVKTTEDDCWLPSCGLVDLRPYGVGMTVDFGLPKD